MGPPCSGFFFYPSAVGYFDWKMRRALTRLKSHCGTGVRKVKELPLRSDLCDDKYKGHHKGLVHHGFLLSFQEWPHCRFMRSSLPDQPDQTGGALRKPPRPITYHSLSMVRSQRRPPTQIRTDREECTESQRRGGHDPVYFLKEATSTTEPSWDPRPLWHLNLGGGVPYTPPPSQRLGRRPDVFFLVGYSEKGEVCLFWNYKVGLFRQHTAPHPTPIQPCLLYILSNTLTSTCVIMRRMTTRPSLLHNTSCSVNGRSYTEKRGIEAAPLICLVPTINWIFTEAPLHTWWNTFDEKCASDCHAWPRSCATSKCITNALFCRGPPASCHIYARGFGDNDIDSWPIYNNTRTKDFTANSCERLFLINTKYYTIIEIIWKFKLQMKCWDIVEQCLNV